jgi:outer membrane receptor protein involved in Fe transport
MKRLLSLIAVLFSTMIFAQTNVTGTVVDDNNDPIPGANVVFDAMTGTVADFDGNFSISVDQTPPFNLTISSVGFESKSIDVKSASLNFNVQLETSQNLLDEIVVAASRVPERLFESAVTIEKFDYKDIAQSTGADFYSSLDGLKGVQVNTGGLLLQQINTRGFSTVWNEGFVQLVDGMNNEAPGLNFSAGNLLGINELDIQSVELMPGAASALYGANATKGILFMNSKNPFDFPGVSVNYKHGITSQKAAGDNYYYDIALRAANKFSDKFAAKFTVSYVRGEDWHAADYSDINNPDGRTIVGETGLQDPTHFPDWDGVNVYGDIGQNFDMTETFVDNVLPVLIGNGTFTPAQGAQFGAIFGTVNPDFFGSTIINASGYKETQLTDYVASSIKTDIAFHYKPTEESEIIFNSKMGGGNTVLQGLNRNLLKNFTLAQHKIEYTNKNLTLRAYTTIEDSGNTHDSSALGAAMVLAQPGGITGYFGGYFNGYFGALPSLVNPNPLVGFATMAGYALNGGAGGTSLEGLLNAKDRLAAHAAGRAAADANLLVPGSPAWDQAYNKAISTGLSLAGGGAGILDQSKSNTFEVNYNLQDLVSIADIIIGGSHRKYILRSNGTLFTDYDAPIEYTDMGMYVQAKKDLFGGALKLTGSMRYDKSEFFDGHITPRLGGILMISQNQNIRFSYQTGYQNPTSQDQYIGLDGGTAVLMGASPDNIERFSMTLRSPITGQSKTYTGDYVFNNSFSLNSVLSGAPEKAELGYVEPQYVKSYDLGYRINGKKTALDINAYYTEWDNFIASKTVITPAYTTLGGLVALSVQDWKVFNVDSNTDEEVSTYGASVGLETALLKVFDLNVTASYNKMLFERALDPDFEPGFNTPQTRVKVSLGSMKLAENFAFNVSAKYHDKYYWQQSGFIDGWIDSNILVDAQVNFMLPKINANIKVGGVNVGGCEYQMMPGSGYIGSQYYVGFTLNP